MRTTYSLRTSTELSTTHCTTPGWSRTSTKARCSPCSRRRATQPHTPTASPTCSRSQLAAQVGAHRGGARHGHRRPLPGREWIRSARVDDRLRLVAAQRSDDGRAGLQLVGADDHGHRGAAAVGGLHLAFMLRPSKARSAERPARRSCSVTASASPPPVVSTTNTSTAGCGGGEHALVVAREQRAVEPEGEADARRRRPAERLDQPVVAAAAAERVLGAVERAAGVLERRAQVVVEAAHQPRLDAVRDAERVEPGADGVEVGCRALSLQKSAIRGAAAIRSRVLAALGVEHAQRVAGQRLPALLAAARRGGRSK